MIFNNSIEAVEYLKRLKNGNIQDTSGSLFSTKDEENPIMLTSDNGLQIKAKGLNITTITLKEFLKQLKY